MSDRTMKIYEAQMKFGSIFGFNTYEASRFTEFVQKRFKELTDETILLGLLACHQHRLERVQQYLERKSIGSISEFDSKFPWS